MAIELVRIEKAYWRDDSKRDVQELLDIPRAQGRLDQWCAKPSGSYFKENMSLTRQERGLRGEMVMQLI